MTLAEIIAQVDEIKPNAFSNEAKTIWINEIEGKIQTDVFLMAVEDVIQYSYVFLNFLSVSDLYLVSRKYKKISSGFFNHPTKIN